MKLCCNKHEEMLQQKIIDLNDMEDAWKMEEEYCQFSQIREFPTHIQQGIQGEFDIWL